MLRELRSYTVLLLYPDYVADTYGQETYLTHVKALDPSHAVAIARTKAGKGLRVKDLTDFFLLFVAEGFVTDLTDEVKK